MENVRKQEDSQILSEIVSNERIIEHSSRGKVRFRFPTLQIQRKIDAATRFKKKLLREMVDQIPDSNAPSGVRIVPAYKSRQVLEHEYADLGWWTPEMESKLDEMSSAYISHVTRLELLGYESYEDLVSDLTDIHIQLTKLTEADLETTENVQELLVAISNVCDPSVTITENDFRIIKNAATSTEVDDLLEKVKVYREQYLAYTEMVKNYSEMIKLDTEKNTLFADSWQSQLDYYNRLAQVFYCTEDVETGKPLYESIDKIEEEGDTEFISWLFSELQALWQGLSDESRNRLGKYTFTQRQGTEKSSTEESPALPQQLEDGDLQDQQQSHSSKALDITESLPQPN